MKHLYTVLLCTLTLSSAVTAATGPRFAARKASARPALAKAANPALVWRPDTRTDYMYMDGEWIDMGTSTFTYDERGNATVELIESEDGVMRIVSTYDAYNKPLSRITSSGETADNLTDESKMTYVYDPVLHGYYTERMGYDWEEDTWVKNYYCETNTIVRNNGNITEITKSLPMGDEMLPAYKLIWIYNENTGRADAMTYYANNAGTTVPEWDVYDDTEYKNIVWDATDGQMTESDITEYLEGPNRIASADVYYEGELDGYVFVTYAAGGYTLRETFANPDEVAVLIVKEPTDTNGSYVMTEAEYFDEAGEYTPEPTYEATITVTCNDKGDVILEEMAETIDDITETVDGARYDYTYDSEGRVTEYVLSIFDYDEGDYIPQEKAVFAGYRDYYDGIAGVSTDADAPAVYFDLQGRPVASPAAGHLYIRVRGGKADKVVL